MQHLTFSLAGEEYALDIRHVREIIGFPALTRVPSMPPHVRGVINLRGSVVPVVDLATRFGLAETVVSRRTCVVIAELSRGGDTVVTGVLADAVSQVLDIAPEDVEEPPALGTAADAGHLLGMARSGEKFVLVLDAARVLAPVTEGVPAHA